jgi:hypothetical protein
MKSNNGKKAIISMLLLFVLLVSSAQALGQPNLKKTLKSTEMRDWYWKQSYPNYAPQGLPDFDQKQDRWKKISPGPDGVINSTVVGDDILNTDENCIAPGPDCYLNSTPAGDDVEEWVFCGPVAVANCLWWFDSKYSDPTGTPGDGEDQFSLVQDYGAGDDHSANNTPLLIENLAREMKTTEKGTTYINDMESAVVNWLNTTGLSDRFLVNTFDRPTFDYIESQVKQSQDVILLLGSYDYLNGTLVLDQSQLNGPHNDLLAIQTWWDYQSFVPTAQRLDSLEILLVSNSAIGCDVQVDVYDGNHGNLIGTATLNPGLLIGPTWVRFDFSPYIPLTSGQTYYFDVLQLDSDYHYEWLFDYPNPYPPGQGWMNNIPTDPYGHPFDWAFKTEFFSPPPGSVRREGHFVTCAGVDSEGQLIAFSDPTLDVANTTQVDHNDAQYVSHDIYTIHTGSPQPDINTQWWLPDYLGPALYTVVEQALIICPVPDATPPTVEITKPINALYFMNKQIFNLTIPVIIGMIDVTVTASDDDSGVDRVEFFIDLQYQGNDTTAPYSWTWTEKSFFYYTIKVTAYDKAGNSASKDLKVWKFF